jgi:ELWxxDGT repeat protein
MKIFLQSLLCISFFIINAAKAQSPYLIKDINTGSNYSPDANINYLITINNTTYFSATDLINGTELWKTDGTKNGTVIVADLDAGVNSSFPLNLTNVNGTLFFTASVDAYGSEIWKTDGTASGTVLVKDIIVGATGSTPALMTNVNGTLFFTAYTPSTGTELWKSDGTTAGTVMVKDIRSGTSTSGINSMVNVNGTLYFNANDGTNGDEVWKSDGTNGGTVLVKNIVTGSGGCSPSNLAAVNSILYFKALTSAEGFELWKTDGTAAGTVIVKDIVVGAPSGAPSNMANINGTLFFQATNMVNGFELWKSDGTAAGTVMVKDIYSGTNSNSGNPSKPIAHNGVAYFTAQNANGIELWQSDGTSAGTYQIADINAGGGNANPSSLLWINDTLFFQANDGINGAELWRTDGTVANTIMVKDICPTSSSSTPSNLVNLNDNVLFAATDFYFGKELWSSNGSTNGTNLLLDINAVANNSTPSNMADVNGTLFFKAYDAINGDELWKSDGTTAGTLLVKNINTAFNNAGGSNPSYLTNINGTVYFAANDSALGTELWKSDGTAAGTVLVKDIYPPTTFNPSTGNPENLTNVNGTLFFTADDGLHYRELWKSDGTTAGTVLVKDISFSTYSTTFANLTNVNGNLFFTATENVFNTYGNELWVSDGTTAGTVMVKDINSGSANSNASNFVNLNGVLYFSANDGFSGNELWKSDGTAAGTVLVKDIYAGSNGANIDKMIHANGTLYFRATTTAGTELWKSDGTAAGTVIVKDINFGGGNSFPSNITNVNGTIFFSADDGNNGYELWKSDGTAAGTIKLSEMIAGIANPNFSDFINVNGTLYFSAKTDTTGYELYKSDGTIAGIILVKDIAAGAQSSTPFSLATSNNKLFFSNTYNNIYNLIGKELWSIGACDNTNAIVNTQARTPWFNEAQISATQRCHCDVYNNLIETIDAIGASPISGIVDAKVWIEDAQPLDFVKRHYEITPLNNASTATAKVTLYFTQTEFTAYNTLGNVDLPTGPTDAIGKANLLIDKYAGVSNVSTGLPNNYVGAITTINPNDTDIVWNALANRWEVSIDVTGFSGFFIRTNNTPLAIDDITFTGEMHTSNDELHWKLTNEKEIDFYTILYSTDAINFEKIGVVNSKANAINNLLEYNFLNHNIGIGHNYYQLQTTNIDGTEKICSKTIDLYRSNNRNTISIYPNPVQGILNIDFVSAIGSNMAITITDIHGKTVKQIGLQSVKGNNHIALNTIDLPIGIYTLQMVQGNKMLHSSLIEKK